MAGELSQVCMVTAAPCQSYASECLCTVLISGKRRSMYMAYDAGVRLGNFPCGGIVSMAP